MRERMALGLFRDMFLKRFNSKIEIIIPTIKDKIHKASVLYSDITGIFLILIQGLAQVNRQKQLVEQLNFKLLETKQKYQKSKVDYENLLVERKELSKQLEVSKDISKLTLLYKLNLELDLKESEYKNKYDLNGKELDLVQDEYLNQLRERYIEEQRYSDSIRQASTFYTWCLIAFQLFLFLFIHLIVEPRKKKQLINDLNALVDHRDKDIQDLSHQIMKLSAKLDEQFSELDQKLSPETANVDLDLKKVNNIWSLISLWNDVSFWKGSFFSFILFILFKA